MTACEFLLFAHLLFVVAWVGTDIGIQGLSFRVLGAAPERVVTFTADIEWLGLRLLTPGALLVLLFGALLVENVGFEWGDTWIVLALIAAAASAAIGAGFLGPEAGRIAKLADERGASDPDVQARIRRILLVSRIELVIQILVILDMVVKPGL
jgi:hypothetical protein